MVFIPAATYAAATRLSLKDETWWGTYHWTWAEMIAQRKPGVSVAQANADLTHAYLASYEAERTTSPRQQPTAVAKPHGLAGSILRERGPNQSSTGKVVGLVGLTSLAVLLIAFANVANLLLSRALRRRREIAVRIALGVTCGRLLLQLLTESLLLALSGGLIGLALAQWGGNALMRVFVPNAARQSVAFDPRTMLVAALAVLAAGVLTGLAPIWQTRRVELALDLKSGAREGNTQRSPLRTSLLLVQGALSVVLLVGAGLFLRSMQQIRATRLGYDVAPVLLVDVNMRNEEVDSVRAIALRHELAAAAATVPGVQSTSLGLTIPFWSTWSMGLYVPGIDSVSKLGQFNLNAVTPEYFRTLGTRVIRGRGIEASDRDGAPRVMVVSASMATKLWPGREAIGQCVRVSADTMPCTTVVGVAEDIHATDLSDDPALFYYLSAPQFHPQQTTIFVRTRGDAAQLVETVRRRLQGVMPGASYITVTPFTDVIGGQTKSWRLGATMFVAFGVLALIVASIGLYSVVAYNVAQRTHEMGVRIALGASVANVVRLVLGQGMRVAIVGVVLGAAIALGAARWIQPLLFETSARDPLVYVVVATLLLGVSAAASLIPARRASRVDPNVALRSE